MRKAISRNCTSLLPIAHECNHLLPLLEGFAEGTTVYADKGYDSKENRQHLKEHQLLDGIMRKAHRNRPLTENQTKRNRYLSKTRYVVEQSFVRCIVNSAMPGQPIWSAQSECAKPSEGDVFEPVESRQQAQVRLLLPKRRLGCLINQVYKDN